MNTTLLDTKDVNSLAQNIKNIKQSSASDFFEDILKTMFSSVDDNKTKNFLLEKILKSPKNLENFEKLDKMLSTFSKGKLKLDLDSDNQSSKIGEVLVEDLLKLSFMVKNNIDIKDFKTNSKELKICCKNKTIVTEFKNAKNIKELLEIAKENNINIKNIKFFKEDLALNPNDKKSIQTIKSQDIFKLIENKLKDSKKRLIETLKKDNATQHTLKSVLSNISNKKNRFKSKNNTLQTDNIQKNKEVIDKPLVIKNEIKPNKKRRSQKEIKITNFGNSNNEKADKKLHSKDMKESVIRNKTFDNFQKITENSVNQIQQKDLNKNIIQHKTKEVLIIPKNKTKKDIIQNIPKVKINTLYSSKNQKNINNTNEVKQKKVVTLEKIIQHISSDIKPIKKEKKSLKMPTDIKEKNISLPDAKIEKDLIKPMKIKSQSKKLKQKVKDISVINKENINENENKVVNTKEDDATKVESIHHTHEHKISLSKHTFGTTEVKKTFNTFAEDFKDQVERYKPPLMKVKMQLNPKGLGDVDVTMINRGNNLHITVTSNHNTISLFSQNQSDFKNSLVNMGFSELSMNFNENGKNKDEQNQKNKNQNSKDFEVINEEESFEITTPLYI